MANDVFRSKFEITEVLKTHNLNARDKRTPSEILSVLKKVHIMINLSLLKGLLRELGFNTSGVACSYLDLIRRCQAIVNGEDYNQKTFMQTNKPREAIV